MPTLEQKKLETDSEVYTFTKKPLRIDYIVDGDSQVFKCRELDLRANSIYNFAMEFDDRYKELQGKNSPSITDLDQIKFILSLGTEVDKLKEKKKKKKVNSRQKGARGERIIIERLDEHFPGLKIVRTPGSGAFATTHDIVDAAGEYILCGDLMASNNGSHDYQRFVKYNWEVKNYEELPDFAGMYYKKSEPILSWIEQAERDATSNGKIFTLIFRANRSPEFIIFHTDYAKGQGFFEPNELIRFRLDSNTYSVFMLKDVSFA